MERVVQSYHIPPARRFIKIEHETQRPRVERERDKECNGETVVRTLATPGLNDFAAMRIVVPFLVFCVTSITIIRSSVSPLPTLRRLGLGGLA